MDFTDWNDVDEIDEEYEISSSKSKNNKKCKMNIIHSLLKSIYLIVNTKPSIEYFKNEDIYIEKLVKNIIYLLKKHLNNFSELRKNSELLKIIMFKMLIYLKIECRILILVDEIKSYIAYTEIVDGSLVIKDPFVHKKMEDATLSKGFIFSIDSSFRIVDHSIYYTTNLKNYTFFNKKIMNGLYFLKDNIEKAITAQLINIKMEIEKIYSLNMESISATEFSEIKVEPEKTYSYMTNIDNINKKNINENEKLISCKNNAFDSLDAKRLNVLPNSKLKLKHHPLYITESLLSHNQIIHPKRPIVGYFKGEPVYYKKNIKILYNKRQLYKIGLEVKENEKMPYRIHKPKNDVKKNKDQTVRKIDKNIDAQDQFRKYYLYAPWQTAEIVYETLKELIEKQQNYYRYVFFFHQNHIPKDSIFIENVFAPLVCEKLNVMYKETVSSFYRTIPVVCGVFVQKKDHLIILNFLSEYCLIKESEDRIKKLENDFSNWTRVLKLLKRYQKVSKRIEI